MGFLMGYGHVEDHPVEPLDLMSVEPALDGGMPHPLDHLVLARLVAERIRRPQLRVRHLLGQAHPPPELRQDLPVDLFDGFANGLEVARGGHGGGV